MRTWWTRLQASRWAERSIWLIAVGLLLVLAAWVAKAVGADDTRLNRLADQAQVVGVALTVAGGVVAGAGWLQRQLRGPETRRDPAELLVARVRKVEADTRYALLGKDTTPANLAFDMPGPHHQTHSQQPSLEQWQDLVRLQQDQDSPVGDLATIDTFFTGLTRRRLVILGKPGSGKTVMAIELTLRLLQPRPDGTTPPIHTIPVRLNLAGWHTGRNLEQWFAERLAVDYAIPPAAASELIQDRRLLPVLDGLDEMDPEPALDEQPPALRRAQSLLDELNAYLDGTQLAEVVLTCRARRYEQLKAMGARLRDATEIRIPGPKAQPDPHVYRDSFRARSRPASGVAGCARCARRPQRGRTQERTVNALAATACHYSVPGRPIRPISH